MIFSTAGTQPGVWATDGTDAGTVRLYSGYLGVHAFLAKATQPGGSVYFLGDQDLWKTDGTAAGTTRVKALDTSMTEYDRRMTASGDTVYFVHRASWLGEELWRTDGTADGTVLVRDISPGAAGSVLQNLTDVDGTLYFAAYVGNTRGLWKTDGTPAGTVPVKDLTPTGPSDGTSHFTSVGGRLFFAHDDGVNGLELWTSDGTPGGTVRLTDLRPGNLDSLYGLSSTLALGDVLLFTAYGPDGTPGLWRSAGTVPGTTQVVALPQSAVDRAPGRLTRGETSTAYFRSADSLWRTDGTAAGTSVVQQLPPGTSSDVTYAAGRYYFTVEDSAGEELWSSDGTAAGTARVQDINPGRDSSFPANMTAWNGNLFFRGIEPAHGSELWKVELPIAAPAAPASFAAVALSGGEIRLSWVDGVENEAAFVLERSATPQFNTVAATVKLPAGTTSHVDTGLAAGTTYHYRLRAMNRGGASTDLTASAATPAAPAAPSALSAAATHERVVLTWTDNAADETGFRVERSPESTFGVVDATFHLPADASTFVDTGVSPETHYFYRVAAVGPAGRSAAATAAATALGRPPTGLIAWAGAPTSVDLQWVPPTSAHAFRVEIQRALPGEPFRGIGSEAPTVNRFFDNDRRPGTTYRYRVRAGGPFGGSVLSDEVSVTTPQPVPATLVKDLNATPLIVGSDPSPIVVWGGVGYFAATDGVNGRELWRTDGTMEGTRLVTDLMAGPGHGIPEVSGVTAGRVPFMAASGGALYFTADDGSHGPELWRTDGTEAGTVQVTDGYPGMIGLSPSWLTDLGGTLFFSGGSGGIDRELWKSDGTAAGTVRVKDIRPGEGSSSPGNLVVMNGVLYFTADDGAEGVELWRSDGTEAGTYRLSDVVPGPGPTNGGLLPESLTPVGDTLYFTAFNDAQGRELWKTDGTVTGTQLVADAAPGAAWGEPRHLFAHGGALLFSANDAAGGFELWRSDGTAAGTARVADLAPGTVSSSPFAFTAFNGRAYFLAFRQSFLQLYETDGTGGGTRLVTELAGIASNTPNMLAAGGGLYFVSSAGGVRLWRSDGTAGGTVPLSPSIVHFPAGGSLAAVGGTVVFPGIEPAGFSSVELWRSDGTPEGTALLKNIRVHTAMSVPTNVTAFNGNVYFTATESPGAGPGLWRSDGTGAGTVLVRAGAASRLTPVGDTLYFVAEGADTGTELWKTDGTAAGTALVADLAPGDASTNFITITAGASRLYFTDRPNIFAAARLWVSDGSAEGTRIVSDAVVPALGDDPLYPSQPAAVGDTLFFRAGTPGSATGLELWKSDGTAAGTAPVKDLLPGPADGLPYAFVNAGGTLYFGAFGPGGTHVLWKSDGTPEGTAPVREGFTGRVSNVTAVGSGVYFVVDQPGAGAELWKGDGTTGGTRQVADVWPGAGGSSPSHVTAVGDDVYFLAADPSYGLGLWTSDGTAGGTRRVRPVYGPIPGYPFHMLAAGGSVFYADAGHWWRSDGTPAGTVRALPFTDGTVDAQTPGAPAAAVGSTVFVRANDPRFGRELWTMSGVPSDPAEPAAVAARHVFYNGSALVGGPPLSPTDAAIAADKVALMPGQTASFRNVTSYARGVNGVIVDLTRLPEASTLSAADFELHVGGPSGWSPLAGAPAVSVRRGAGAAGADRVTLTLPDYAARNTWLRVTVKATPGTGLASADTFYFGNLVGDTGGPGTPRVDVFDLAHTRAAVGRSTAAALNTFDFNRDGRINAIDLVIVRNNHGRTLTLFTAPSAAATAAAAGAFSRQTVAPPPGRSRGGPDRRGIWDEPMQDLLS